MLRGQKRQIGWSTFRVLIIAIGVLLGCSGGGGGGGGNGDDDTTATPVIRGRLGTTFQARYLQSSDDLGFSESVGDYLVEEVWGLPVGGPLDVSCLEQKQVFAVNDDGSFELTLPTDTVEHYIYMLMDLDAAEKIDRFVGYIALADIQENLILIPAQEVSDDIDLGEIELDGEEAVSDTTLAQAADYFSLDLEQLTEMARTDDLFKMVKNLYVNYDPSTEISYRVQMNFLWEDDLANIDDQFADPMAYDYRYYSLYIFSNDMTHIDLQGLADGQWVAAFYPPSDLLWEAPDVYVGPTNPISSNNVTGFSDYQTCAYNIQDEDFWLCSSDTVHLFSLPAGGIKESLVAPGYWYLEREQSTDPALDRRLAIFDLAPATPLYASGYPKAYVPVAKIITGENRRIEQIEVRWYLYDQGIGGYREVTDLSAMQETVTFSPAMLIDYNAGAGESGIHVIEQPYISHAIQIADFNESWYMPGATIGPDDNSLQYFSITFELGGANMSFTWMPNS